MILEVDDGFVAHGWTFDDDDRSRLSRTIRGATLARVREMIRAYGCRDHAPRNARDARAVVETWMSKKA